MDKLTLSPRERQLLKELNEIYEGCKQLSDKLISTETQLENKEKELSSLQREFSKLKEENQHQKELIQTWKNSLESSICNLPEIDE